MTFEENLKKLKKIDDVKNISLYSNNEKIVTIENIEGKKGSLTVYANLLGFEDGRVSKNEAQKGLELFAEHVEDAKSNPGKHPNIDLLLKMVSVEYDLKASIKFNIPEGLKESVEKYFEMGSGVPDEEKQEALDTVNQVLDLLEKGWLRTAGYEGNWVVNTWVKKAVLLAFRLGSTVVHGEDFKFTDKDTLPLREPKPEDGFRATPPASALRRGSYVGKGCILMSPAYVNVGAFIGQGSMVEGLAGSCCQIGRNCHISAGTVVGGVLDPIEATPVVIGDNVLLGEGTGVTQGSRLGDLVTLAPGVHISKATPVLDPINNVAYTSKGINELVIIESGSLKLYKVGDVIKEKNSSYGPEVPKGALVIPGVSVSSNGTLKSTPMIAKYITKSEERSYALEQALRE